MLIEPVQKRAVVFVDGQNLYHATKDAFNYTYPNYDVEALAKAVSLRQGWELIGIRFYTGVPAPDDNAARNHF